MGSGFLVVPFTMIDHAKRRQKIIIKARDKWQTLIYQTRKINAQPRNGERPVSMEFSKEEVHMSKKDKKRCSAEIQKLQIKESRLHLLSILVKIRKHAEACCR